MLFAPFAISFLDSRKNLTAKSVKEYVERAKRMASFSGSWPQHFQNQITNKNFQYSGKLGLPLFLPRTRSAGSSHQMAKKAVSFYD
jgi:hypothetical protein